MIFYVRLNHELIYNLSCIARHFSSFRGFYFFVSPPVFFEIRFCFPFFGLHNVADNFSFSIFRPTKPDEIVSVRQFEPVLNFVRPRKTKLVRVTQKLIQFAPCKMRRAQTNWARTQIHGFHWRKLCGGSLARYARKIVPHIWRVRVTPTLMPVSLASAR